MANRWVDIRTIDNNTPFYNVAWKASWPGSTVIDSWFSEKSGLTTDNNSWTNGTTNAMGYFTYHRYNTNQYTCTFDPQYKTGNGSNVEYGVSVANGERNTLPVISISGKNYYALNISDWNYWVPLYAPFSTSVLQSDRFKVGAIMVYLKPALSIDPETIQAVSTSSSYTVTLESEGPWTASTQDSWIGVSPSTGTTGGTITITTSQNPFDNRTGTVIFSNGEDTTTLTVTQEGQNSLCPITKLFYNGDRII